MQNKLFILVTLQVCCITFFVITALACKTVGPTVTYRAPHTECQSGDYLYIGAHSSEEEAQSVAHANGMNEVCSSEQNKGTYFAK